MSFNPSQFLTSASGFGQASLDRARAAGYTDEQIKAGLQGSGITVGELAAQSLGGSSAAASGAAASGWTQGGSGRTFDPSQFLGTAGVAGGFGEQSLIRARAAGYSDSEIMSSVAAAGWQMGEKALSSLNQSVDAGSGQSYGWSQHNLRDGSTVFASGPGNVDFSTWTSPAARNIAAQSSGGGGSSGGPPAAPANRFASTPAGGAAPGSSSPAAPDVPEKSGSAGWGGSFGLNLQPMDRPFTSRSTDDLYEDRAANAGGERNNQASLDYSWRWEDREGGQGDAVTAVSQEQKKDDEPESFSDSWRRYTASGQPLAGSVFGGR